MSIKTLSDLIDWTRQLHDHLARCLAQSATKNQDERARALLDYLASHESKLEKMVKLFENQADPKLMHSYVYDYLSNQLIETHRTSTGRYADLGFDNICKEVFDLHHQVLDLYRYLDGKIDTLEATRLLHSLLSMEEHEAMRLVRQTGRMQDL